MTIEQPKELKAVHNLAGTKDIAVLFNIFELFMQVDRLHFFVTWMVEPTDSINDRVCVEGMWLRYRAWNGRDNDPLPEAQFIERMQKWGYYYNEELHCFEMLQVRDTEQRFAESKKTEKKLAELRGRHRGLCQTGSWDKAGKLWEEIQQHMEQHGLTHR